MQLQQFISMIRSPCLTLLIGERKGGAFNHFSVTTSDDEEDLNDMLTNMHKVVKSNLG